MRSPQGGRGGSDSPDKRSLPRFLQSADSQASRWKATTNRPLTHGGLHTQDEWKDSFGSPPPSGPASDRIARAVQDAAPTLPRSTPAHGNSFQMIIKIK